MVLEAEIRYFDQHCREWLNAHAGEFAVIRDKELLGFFATDEEALKAGVGKWGSVSFLIREVLDEQRIEKVPALACGLMNDSL